mgnify:CR=1 FL=1
MNTVKMMSHPFMQETIKQETMPLSPKPFKGYESLTDFGDEPEVDGMNDWIE